jgi:hypothetical protein
VPEVDTIGVPVFTAIRGNEMFVPEMDGDFRITRFLEFFNEHGFQISYELPPQFHNQDYALGSPAPIPFWISKNCYVIEGDADKEEPAKLFGLDALRNPVLSDIARLLDDARSGRINDRNHEWMAENIANGFGDVFFETPIRSRYWVTRYRVAVAKARNLTKPPHPIDVKLRHVAGEWFQRFGTKTDLAKLGGMLGSSASEIFSKRQMTDILFGFLINKLARGERDDIEAYIREPTLQNAFPEGIYNYYIQHGWPRVPFHYEQVDDMTERMMRELLVGREQENFRPAAKMALLLYGRARAPSQVETLAGTYLNSVSKEFEKMRKEANAVFKSRATSQEWEAYAEGLLDYYNQLMDLDGIINGKDRLMRIPVDRRFGVPLKYLDDLKNIRKGDW